MWETIMLLSSLLFLALYRSCLIVGSHGWAVSWLHCIHCSKNTLALFMHDHTHFGVMTFGCLFIATFFLKINSCLNFKVGPICEVHIKVLFYGTLEFIYYCQFNMDCTFKYQWVTAWHSLDFWKIPIETSTKIKSIKDIEPSQNQCLGPMQIFTWNLYILNLHILNNKLYYLYHITCKS